MAVLTGYDKYKRYVKTDSGYKLMSQWTNSNTIEFDDGKTAQTKLGDINGITNSLVSTSSDVALAASAGKSLQDQITTVNSNLANKLDNNYKDNSDIKKGIVFDKNADGSYFTFRPVLSNNLLQITKNDDTNICWFTSSGNMIVHQDIITETGLSLSSINENLNKLDIAFCESTNGRNHINNLLQIDPTNYKSDIHKIQYFGSNQAAASFKNCPPLDSTMFYGYRVVRWCSDSNNKPHLITVELHEQFPNAGRVWANTYDATNGNWYGWHEH